VVAQTERVRLSGNALNRPLRAPAVLARAAASLDLLSGVRFELALGSASTPDMSQKAGPGADSTSYARRTLAPAGTSATTTGCLSLLRRLLGQVLVAPLAQSGESGERAVPPSGAPARAGAGAG
jgi:Luciferase-like monooxygenase